jgi:hypothetical protein
LRAVAGSPGGDAWAFGVDGTIAVQRPSGAFTRVTEAVVGIVSDVWVGDSDRAWVTNGFGVVGYYDGTAWVALPLTKSSHSGPHINAGIWASSTNQVFVAENDLIAQWNGVQWTNINGQPWGTTDLWASGPDDVWYGRDRLNRWDGTSWTTVSTNPVVMIDGTGADDVWVLENQAVERWTGSSLTQLGAPEMKGNGGLWLSGGNIYVAGDNGGSLGSKCDYGGYVLGYDGNSWSTLLATTTGCGFIAIAGRSATDYWVAREVVPYGSTVLQGVVHQQGNTGTEEVLPGAPVVTRLIAASDETIWACGGNGVYYRRP